LVLRDDDSRTNSARDFVSQADQICRQSQREFDQVQRRPPRTASQAENQAEALIDVSEDALRELRGLEVPEGARESYDRYIAAREKALGYLEDGRDAAADKDPKAYAAAKRNAAADQATRLQLARSLGLRDCSRPSVTLGAGGS
jgi:hypothetical protein